MSKQHASKSSKAYALAGGVFCPVCGGSALDRAPAGWPENGWVHAWVACETCRHVWKESYRLAGYSELEEPVPVSSKI
jgi:hypothetical protein